MPGNVGKILATERDRRSPEQQTELAKYAVKLLQKQLAAIKPLSTPIMQELPAGKGRKTRIHIRGNFLDQGKEVTPGVPSSVSAISTRSGSITGLRPAARKSPSFSVIGTKPQWRVQA